MADLPKPPPPVVGKVTHFSIELYWGEALENAVKIAEKDCGKVRVCLQEEDHLHQWGNVYTGYAKRYIVSGLDPQTEYKYRIQFRNSNENSDWGAHTVVSTTKEPLTGEHLHKAIIRRDIPELERILENSPIKIDVPDKYGFSGLMQASQKGYVDIVEVLLKSDADVHTKNDSGKTALMLACFAGQKEVVILLRKYGAKYEEFDRGGSTPLHWAVDGGNIRLLEWMIQDGADVNMRDRNSKWTPLLRCASVTGNRDVALTLLMNNADINAQDKDGKTTLMIAIINGHQALMELLLKRKADLNVKNEYGKTAYDMAISMEKRRIVRALDEHLGIESVKSY